MKNLFKKEVNVKEVIEEIHHSFNNAGQSLVEQANEVLNQRLLDKSERLKKAGFANVPEVEQGEKIRISIEIAEKVQYYQMKYPNQKFITNEQVEQICGKYNLTCAPVTKYKGFVPEKNLKEIEAFKFDKVDKKPVILRILSVGSGTPAELKRLKDQIGEVIPAYDKRLLYDPANRSWPRIKVDNEWFRIESYDVIENNEMLICAPEKDFTDTKGLAKIGAVMTSYKNVTIPDPVVLWPCVGGYLILTAWGDETSDENVINPKSN